LTEEGMGTKNLLINEKACARNCMAHAITFKKYLNTFERKLRSDKMHKYDQVLRNTDLF